MSNDICWSAVRAFRRVWAPRASLHDEATEADARFDAGEWSTHAHAELEEHDMLAVAQRVSVHFGISADALIEQVWAAGHVQDDCFQRAMIKERSYETA